MLVAERRRSRSISNDPFAHEHPRDTFHVPVDTNAQADI